MDLKHGERLSKVEERSKSNAHRIEDIEKRQDNLDKLAGAVAALAEREKHVENDVKEIKSVVNGIAEKPGKRWEALISQLITIVVAAVFGFLLAKFGL